MKKNLVSHFPQNSTKFKLYLKNFVPIVMGSLLFSLNGVVDNFMVGRIEQGVTALSAVNQWGFIIFGWFFAIAAAGRVITAQFYHANNIDYVKKISQYRTLLCFLFVIPFAIIAWTYPNILINTFYKKSSDAHVNAVVYKYAKEYIEIIAFQWLLITFTFNVGTQFAEIGYGKYRMYFGVATLSVNIFLNSMLIFVANMKVQGAAIATVGGRIIFIILSIFVIRKHRIPISFNFLNNLKMDKRLLKIFWQRWIYIFSTFTVYFFIAFRGFFYARGYPSGTLGIGVSSTSVLGLTGAIMSMFTITFSALGSMSALFVSSELGKGNYKQAKINSDELKGFNTLMAFILTIGMFMLASFIPYMEFLSTSQYNNGKLTFSSKSQLIQVRNSLFVIAAMYPLWIWFSTSYRNGNAGGKGNRFAIMDWITSGPLQLGWLAVVMLVIVPSWPLIQNNFAVAYALFFISDFFKMIGMEILYYTNTKWLHSITKSEMK